MIRFSATMRIAIGLACLTVSVLLAAKTIGLVPDRQQAVMQGRSTLCEAIAINLSLLASKGDVKRMEAGLTGIVKRNPDMLSAAVRRADGKLLVDVGDHAANWQRESDGRTTHANILVPIVAGDSQFGTVEMRFRPLRTAGLLGWFTDPLIVLVGFVSLVGFAAYVFYLRKMLQHLDPSNVVPDRVRAALDTLAEGLLVMDKEERIVLANQSFSRTIGRSPSELQGRRVSELPWIKNESNGKSRTVYPWSLAINEGATQLGSLLSLEAGDSKSRTFKVNSAPILSDEGVHRGALVSFDDVTILEEKKSELSKMLTDLQVSREEIRSQNEELRILATQDHLTGCLNRRSFFQQFETHWKSARRYGHPLSCVMVDVDRFKSINDTHGHMVGDRVLRKVAGALTDAVRDVDLLCRYGGEEFCILLPHIDIDGAVLAAERYRKAIEDLEIPEQSVTASLGVSAIELGASELQQLLDQADKCLYVAKRNGRNQVVRWDVVPENVEDEETPSNVSRSEPAAEMAIPFHAVTALVSALSYRDIATAEHSRRVADLCVAAAHGLISARDAFVLETAALLHDIGKIGVPDAILLKPGALTKQEWEVMGVHDQIGVEIIRATFDSEELVEIVESHHAFYGGKGRDPGLPSGDDIPLGARILTIADAYDAMTSDRVYRKGRSPEEAFEELRRCAGSQFDPELVERFIEAISARDQHRAPAPPTTVTRQTALQIGLQVERLALAVHDQDIESLAALANCLNMVAGQYGVQNIANRAAEIEAAATSDGDLTTLVELTSELVGLCRSAQRSYFEQCDASSTDDEDGTFDTATELEHAAV